MDDLRPINYTFRFTFTEQDKTFQYEDQIPRWRAMSRNLVKKLFEHDPYKISKLTGGIETINKDGDRTWCHLHVHFASVGLRDTIAKFIREYLRDTYDQDTKGIKHFQLKPWALLNSERGYYQYCLKESLDPQLCYGFTSEDLNQMHEVAKESLLKVQEIRQKKLCKKDTSECLYDRLCDYLDKTKCTNRSALRCHTSTFYVEDKRALNKQTMSGYVDTYMLSKKYITHEEYWA